MNLFQKLLCTLLTVSSGAAGAQTTRQINLSVTTTSVQAPPPGAGDLRAPENDLGPRPRGSLIDGTSSQSSHPHSGHGPEMGREVDVNFSPGRLERSFAGINFREQRLANDGQNFSVEPADTGVAVGNGYVVETVASALRVFDTRGHALLGVTDLNTFYGYPAAFANNGDIGPLVTDPYCYFDPHTQRWFVLVLTLDREGVSFDFNGKNHFDLAVSKTSNPLGGWNIYRIATQNDGSDGTPNHHCLGGPCLGDFPRFGIDRDGVYVTTNELALFDFQIRGAQIYALSKAQLVAGSPSVTMVQFDTENNRFEGNAGFTLAPATTPRAEYATELGGTEYFLSSIAVFNPDIADHRLRIWALSNTSSLKTSTPALTLRTGVVNVESYAAPPLAKQKRGPTPLADCINDRTLETPLGNGCWHFFFGFEPPPATDELVDTGDTRMQQIVLADGKLWGALDTAITHCDHPPCGPSQTTGGFAWFVLAPHVSTSGATASVRNQGYVGLRNNHVSHPAIAVNSHGEGAISFSLVGKDFYPSAAFTTIDECHGTGDISIAALGSGPEDGFSGYEAFGGGPFARFGDFSAAAVENDDDIWIASEYVAQRCTFREYTSGDFGSCRGERFATGNWATRISKVRR